MTPTLDLRQVTKTYGSGEAEVTALRGVDLTVQPGEYVAIVGSSGSGKSTLMNIIGCLDVATTGHYLLDGHDVSELDQDTLALVRNRKIGFVFQSFHLIPRMSARDNVELPMIYAGRKRSQRLADARHLLELVGLTDREKHRPNELSGGQQQRVAIARALSMSPALLLADEPTGNLDSHSSEDVMALLSHLHTSGRTIVLITHEDSVAARADRIVTVRDGMIVADTQAVAA